MIFLVQFSLLPDSCQDPVIDPWAEPQSKRYHSGCWWKSYVRVIGAVSTSNGMSCISNSATDRIYSVVTFVVNVKLSNELRMYLLCQIVSTGILLFVRIIHCIIRDFVVHRALRSSLSYPGNPTTLEIIYVQFSTSVRQPVHRRSFIWSPTVLLRSMVVVFCSSLLRIRVPSDSY